MAIFRFQPAGYVRLGPKRANLGSNGHRFGVQTRPKADTNVTQLYSCHQQRQPDPTRHSTVALGTGPFLAFLTVLMRARLFHDGVDQQHRFKL